MTTTKGDWRDEHAPDCDVWSDLPLGCTCQAFAKGRTPAEQARIERGRRISAPKGRRDAERPKDKGDTQ